MKKLNKLLIIIAIAITAIFTSCKSQHIPTYTEVKTDSVYVEKIVERVDTLKIEIPVEVFSTVTPDSSHLETSVAISDASIDELGMLHHTLQNKSVTLDKEIVYQDKYITVEKEVEVTKEIENRVEVVPSYYRTINTIFWIVVALVILYIVARILIKIYLHK